MRCIPCGLDANEVFNLEDMLDKLLRIYPFPATLLSEFSSDENRRIKTAHSPHHLAGEYCSTTSPEYSLCIKGATLV